MIVVLPDWDMDLESVERRLKSEYESWVSGLTETLVDLRFPRFLHQWRGGLEGVLAAMGRPLAFTAAADFGGMVEGEHVAIDKVVQCAFIEVNESGTEAVAATGLTAVWVAAHPPPEFVEFHADHPFQYLIRDPESGVVLFAGRVVDPLRNL